MKRFMAAVLLCLTATVFSPAWAANEGDTHTTSVTTCAWGSGSCTTTITEMTYINGRWVVTSVRTIVTSRNPTTKER
jgi:hypothetical protein